MSDFVEQLAEAWNIPVRVRGGLPFIRREDCGRIVEECRARKVLILGIDAFRLVGEDTIPEDDLIADFSELVSKPWDIACLQAARAAESYFGEISPTSVLWFEFTLRQG